MLKKNIFLITVIIYFAYNQAQIMGQLPAEFRAVKLTNVDSNILFSNDATAAAMDYLASININCVLAVVWNGNSASGTCTLFPSATMASLFGIPIHPSFTNRDALERVVIEAHRNGIEVFPWFEMGFSTSYSQNGGHIISTFPHWALEDTNGNLVVKNGFDWMSAINPEVQNLIMSLTMEVVDNYDIDGIEYSDRIPAMPVEGGYDSVTVDIYKSEHGGASPPTNFHDINWKHWRADKLSQFYKNVRDSIKYRSNNIIVSSSPSLYPWSYNEYLQDSKTWVDSGIVDNIIPQLYRYNYNDYLTELNLSLNNYPNHHHVYFAGMIIKHGSWSISNDPGYFIQAISANRTRNVMGEAFFFYEGLRDNNNLIGDTLRATYYNQTALLPYRTGIWRPKATIVNEDDSNVQTTGPWIVSSIAGFNPNILINEETSIYAKIEYTIDVPFEACFDIYTYNVTGPLAAANAKYTIYTQSDSIVSNIDQTNIYKKGWQFLSSAYLTAGPKKIAKLDNSNSISGEKLTADAVMIMINRKLSPDVIVNSVGDKNNVHSKKPDAFTLTQNYPNPFNSETRIKYKINSNAYVNLSVYNILGQKIGTFVNKQQNAGIHNYDFNANDLASGIYYYTLTIKNDNQEIWQNTKKMVVMN